MAITEGVSLGAVRPPAEADIVAMEAQSFGLPPSYGGPYAGVIATREKFVRQMPGRLAGETTDAQGRRGFCLRWPRANSTFGARRPLRTSAPIRRSARWPRPFISACWARRACRSWRSKIWPRRRFALDGTGKDSAACSARFPGRSSTNSPCSFRVRVKLVNAELLRREDYRAAAAGTVLSGADQVRAGSA